MMNKNILFMAAAIMLVMPVYCFSQDSDKLEIKEEQPLVVPSQTADEPSMAVEPVDVPPLEENTEWVWGDIVSIDASLAQFAIKYLDYETDIEKEITISIDDKTIFEGAKDLSEIKLQDSVSVDYVVLDAKNVARLISVEKIPQDLEETTPAS